MTSDRPDPAATAARRSPDAADPCGPITDDPSYRAALLVLDRLFDLGERKTPAQVATFRSLATQARRHEIRRGWAVP